VGRSPAALLLGAVLCLLLAACGSGDRAGGAAGPGTDIGATEETVPGDGSTEAALAGGATEAAPEGVDDAERPEGSGTVGSREESARPGATSEVPTRPAWLGSRVLEVGPSGFPPPQPTPPELTDRRLPPPPSDLPEPDDERYAASIDPVPPGVLARSTWSEGCPVAVEDLRYLTVTFWGFDGGHHTGELLVHAEAAEDLVEVFGRLHGARFPIEEMRVIRAEELDLPPTGDGNVTTAFVCRDTRGTTSWSQHALGLAVDINPFHNPYLRDATSGADALTRPWAVVLPELATSYVDRGDHRPGMIQPGDVVTEAFAAIGWGWGGDWSSLADWMHFSRSGR
jgi:hypothetical protein